MFKATLIARFLPVFFLSFNSQIFLDIDINCLVKCVIFYNFFTCKCYSILSLNSTEYRPIFSWKTEQFLHILLHAKITGSFNLFFSCNFCVQASYNFNLQSFPKQFLKYNSKCWGTGETIKFSLPVCSNDCKLPAHWR